MFGNEYKWTAMKTLFGFFINSPDKETECTLSRFSDDTKLGGVAAVLTGGTSTDKHHETQEAWVREAFLRFLFEKFL